MSDYVTVSVTLDGRVLLWQDRQQIELVALAALREFAQALNEAVVLATAIQEGTDGQQDD